MLSVRCCDCDASRYYSSFLSTVGSISDLPTQLAGSSCNNGTELAIATTALSGRSAHEYGEFWVWLSGIVLCETLRLCCVLWCRAYWWTWVVVPAGVAIGPGRLLGLGAL